MSPEMHTVLWITAVGSAVLFAALACLVGLMYLLTAPWLFPKGERPAPKIRRRNTRRRFRRKSGEVDRRAAVAAEIAAEEAERESRRRAVALAVAIACAESSQTLMPDASSDWRLYHRARRLEGAQARKKVRS